MKTKTITVRYTEKLTSNFETVEYGETVEIEMEEGETHVAVLRAVRPGLIERVSTVAAERIQIVTENKNREGRR